MTGATFKNKVTSVKHKPAGGITMLAGLINGDDDVVGSSLVVDSQPTLDNLV